MPKCIFCQIIKKEIPSKFFFEDNHLIVFHDINPKAPVHLLIVPKKHILSVNELEEKDSVLISKMVYRAKKTAKELGISKNGYRLVFNCGSDGGQAVGHLHLHLLGGKKLSF